jgi:hypothetical protein
MTWSTIIPATTIVKRNDMVAELTAYRALLAMHEAAPPVLASAATVAIAGGTAASAGLVEISGTTTISGFGADGTLGTRRLVRTQGALTLTHSAALALPGASNVTTEAGTLLLAERTAAGWRVLDIRLPSLMSPGSIDVTGAIRTYLQNNVIRIHEERADGTHNGATTAGSWQARGVTLTEVLDGGGHASVSGATFTLAAGTYDITVEHCFGNAGGGLRGRLYNTTANEAVAGSLSATATHGNPATYNTNWRVPSRCRVTLGASATFRLEYFAQIGVATFGLGGHDNVTAGPEIYSTVEAVKVG